MVEEMWIGHPTGVQPKDSENARHFPNRRTVDNGWKKRYFQPSLQPIIRN
jgi:hypothetical protein